MNPIIILQLSIGFIVLGLVGLAFPIVPKINEFIKSRTGYGIITWMVTFSFWFMMVVYAILAAYLIGSKVLGWII